MDFGIMFFASQAGHTNAHAYQFLIEATKFADRQGFHCVWTPERHFEEFGSIFPNPSVMSAALAMITEQIQLRSGSLISPLHDTVRIAEEWAVVDNLSQGRVAISFGSGWNVNDFIFFPERYAQRRNIMFQQISELQLLWQGGQITRKNSFDKDVEITLYPKPIQARLPVWVTSSGNVDTMIQAGKIEANILTHLIGQDIETLAEKIRAYRTAYTSANPASPQGRVALMLHTFLGPSDESVRNTVRKPFREYLKSAIVLENKASLGGGTQSGGRSAPYQDIPEDLLEELLDITFERYYQHAALMGTPEMCQGMIKKLEAIGVDEIACLIDFGVTTEEALKSLEYLDALRAKLLAEL